MKLFLLCRESKILGAEWDGWRIKRGRLVDPDGNETTQSQLRAYYLVYQLCHELARTDAAASAHLSRIAASIA